MLCILNDLDKNLLHYHIHFIILFNIVLQSLNLFFMSDMSLHDEFICRRDHGIMNLEHGRDNGYMVVEIVVVSYHIFFQDILQPERDELIQLIGSVKL